MIGAITVNARTGKLYHQPFPSAYPASHNGRDMMQAVLDKISRPPFSLTRRRCRSDCSSVGGDGQMVRGGFSQEKPSTKAAEFLWNDLFSIAESPHSQNTVGRDEEFILSLTSLTNRDGLAVSVADDAADVAAVKAEWLKDASKLHAPTVGDAYHREVIIMARARAAAKDCAEISGIIQVADNFFHFGDGVKVLRCASELSGAPTPMGSSWISLARESVGLLRETSHLKKHFAVYVDGLHASESWRQLGHHSKTLTSIVDAKGKNSCLCNLLRFWFSWTTFWRKCRRLGL